MKAAKLPLILAIVALVTMSACKNNEAYKPPTIGSLGEVLVVIDEHWRERPEGQALMEILRQPMVALPQNEAIFTVSSTPHRAFSGTMKTYRNLIIVNLGSDVEKEGVRYFGSTSFAQNQAMIHINAKTPEKFIELVRDEEIKIVGYILRHERERILSSFNTIIDASLSQTVLDQWGMSMTIPNIMRKNAGTGKFTWLSHETASLSQGIMIYSFDYVGEGTFSREYLLNKRDSILRYNIPGPSEGSYMGTELDLPVTYKRFTLNNHETVELRGLWKTVGDIMGGPFVLFAHHDKANNRVVVTDGYVYLPEEPKKRNYIWQLESLFYSVEFPGDKTNEEATTEK